MKYLWTVFFLVVFSVSNAQQKQYNTYIDTAGSVKIYGNGKTVIGKVIIQQAALNKRLVLVGDAIQSKDSSGIYFTNLNFKSAEGPVVYNLDLKIHFNKPIVSVAGYGTYETGYMEGYSNDRTIYERKATELHITGEEMLMVISSKERITAIEVTGIAGIIRTH